jgi:oligopeptide/dipeptide ABC transporter ATP-binding protein
MYAGRIVESASAKDLFKVPHHPYTRALLESVPRADTRDRSHLATLEGLPPRLDLGRFKACSFAPRCRFVTPACRLAEPELRLTTADRRSRCVLSPEELA